MQKPTIIGHFIIFQEKNKLKAEISNQQQRRYQDAGKSRKEKAHLDSKCSDLVEKFEVIAAENVRLEKELKQVQSDQKLSLRNQETKWQAEVQKQLGLYDQINQNLQQNLNDKIIQQKNEIVKLKNTIVEVENQLKENDVILCKEKSQLKEELNLKNIQIQKLNQVIFLKVAIPKGWFLSLFLFVANISIILSNVQALYSNRAVTILIFRWSSSF